LPDICTVRTLPYPRVASFLRKYRMKTGMTSRLAIHEAGQHGIIALTFTA